MRRLTTKIKVQGDVERVEKILSRLLEMYYCHASPIMEADQGGGHCFITVLGEREE